MTDRLVVITADAIDGLRTLPDASAQTCVTSPPYWGLRDYGCDGQIGLEQTPEQYVSRLVDVFREVRRVLADDGTLWLNLGDSYANDGKWGGSSGGKHVLALHGSSGIGRGKRDTGLKPKDLVGIPWMVAFALRADGWYLRSDIIWCLSGGTKLYARTKKGEAPHTLKDLVRLDPSTVQLWNGERWTQVLGWSQSPRPDDALEIELCSGERIGCTPGHQWPTARGLLRAADLVVGDVVGSCMLPEPPGATAPAMLGEDAAWFAGLYIAEGSRSGSKTQIASHSDEAGRFDRLRKIARDFGGSVSIHQTSDNGATANLSGPVLSAIVEQFVSGERSSGKHLHPRCWAMPNSWLRALLDGYLSGDGHYDAANDRWRLGFCQNDALAADLRTIAARLGVTLRLRRARHAMNGRTFPGWRGELRFARSGHHNEKAAGKIVAIRRSRARKFWDVGVADEPHTFALASGVLTHNSKPNPMPESVTDRPTKAHEYVFLLSKSARYFYDAEAVREPATHAGRVLDYTGDQKANSTDREMQRTHPKGRKITVGDWRNKRTVWTIASQPFAGAHFATMPPVLAETCIKAGSRFDDVVLDPFGGAGTTALAALELGRRAVLVELNPEYVEIIERRTRAAQTRDDVAQFALL